MIGLTIDRGSIFNIIEGLLCFNGSQYSIERDHLFSIIITGCRYCMGVIYFVTPPNHSQIESNCYFRALCYICA